MMESEFFVEENHFHRLPTELIISIFDKISDPKWLCVCCSVSKHFASLVLQTRSVSVPIPSTNILQSADGVLVWPPGIIDFLKKLHCLKSVTIRFSFGISPLYGYTKSASLVRWKSDSSSFILVFAKKNCVASSSDDDRIRMLKDFFRTVLSHLRDNALGFWYIKGLLVLLPKLKNVSVVDCMNQGRIVLEEQGIASVKKETPSLHKLDVKWWRRSLVKLPFSNCVMKDVILLSMRKSCDDGLMEMEEFNLFGEKEYCELVMILMKEDATNSESTIPPPMKVDIADFEDSLIPRFLIFMRQVGVIEKIEKFSNSPTATFTIFTFLSLNCGEI